MSKPTKEKEAEFLKASARSLRTLAAKVERVAGNLDLDDLGEAIEDATTITGDLETAYTNLDGLGD